MTPRMLTQRDYPNGYGVALPGVSSKMNFPVRLESGGWRSGPVMLFPPALLNAIVPTLV